MSYASYGSSPPLVHFATATSCRKVLQCVAVCCSVLQCVAVCCGVCEIVSTTALAMALRLLQTFATILRPCCRVCCSMLHCVALCCCELQDSKSVSHLYYTFAEQTNPSRWN